MPTIQAVRVILAAALALDAVPPGETSDVAGGIGDAGADVMTGDMGGVGGGALGLAAIYHTSNDDTQGR